MAKTLDAVDISGNAELVRLVDQVRATGDPRVLNHGEEAVALLSPIDPGAAFPRRQPTAEDYAAFRDAAGSWRGTIDAEKFLEENYDSRRRSSRPAVSLCTT